MQKKAIRYHRFSSEGQSTGSIERQEIVTDLWSKNNDVEITDTFKDDGYSARTFDRPDIQNLFKFIKAQKNVIDYLLVAELTRFSRELGDAINMVKEIQLKYGIKIVSCSRNMIYDCKDHTSFFMMSIELTIGNTDNLKRESDINGGIYTAKVKEQRFIGPFAPFGYKKEGIGKNKNLVIVPEQAAVIDFIFTSFLNNTPIKYIADNVIEMGLKKKGNSVVQKILANPIYCSLQHVKPWRDHPGGLFPAKHESIVDQFTWQQAQQKLHGKKAKGISISDELPLKSVLKCHCGLCLTGAPSRGKMGTYYYYYKCKISKHNNISAIKIHHTIEEIMQYLSVPDYIIEAIKETSEEMLGQQLIENKKQLTQLKRKLDNMDEKLRSIEEKFINNQLQADTYNRWFNDCTQQKHYYKSAIDKLNKTENDYHTSLYDNIYSLTDLKYLYNSFDTVDKQQLLNLVFDHKLYFQDGIVRTPYLHEIFKHNELILKEKGLLLIDKKRDFLEKVPVGGAIVTIIEPLTNLLQFISLAKQRYV